MKGKRALHGRMVFSQALISSLLLIALASSRAMAQGRSEIAFSLGMGSLETSTGGGSTGVFSLSYTFHITRHFSAEGALDFFNYKIPGINSESYNDDYHGAEAAVLYYFIHSRETRRLLPFVAAGIGKTTTDFTEIPAHIYYRLGAGIAYHLNSSLGLRMEARDEIIAELWTYGRPSGHLPSVRCGIAYRF